MELWILAISLFFGALCALVANRKSRRGRLWFIIGFFCGLLGLVVVLCMGDGTKGKVKCARCKEYIKVDALACKHCGFKKYEDEL